MITNYTDEDIAAIMAAQQANALADAEEVDAREEGDTALSDRIDAIIIPLPGEMDPNILQVLNQHELAMQQETADRIAGDAELETAIAAIIPGEPIDPAIPASIADLENRVDVLEANVADNTLAIADETAARIDQYDNSITPQFNAVNQSISDLSAQLVKEISDRSAADAAQATQITAINATLADALQQIADEETARTTADSSFSDSIATISADLATAQQQIDYLSGIGVDPEGALASQILDLTARVTVLETDLASEIADRDLAMADMASDISTLSTAVSTNTTNIANETSARTLADTGLQSQIDTLNTSVTSNTSAITAEATTRAAADTTLTNNLSALSGTVDNLAASLASEIAAGDIVENDLFVITGIVDGHTTDINDLLASVTVIEAQKVLTVDGSGRVTGFKNADNSSPSPSFLMAADKFYLSTAGVTAQAPFSVGLDGLHISQCTIDGQANIILGQISTSSFLYVEGEDPIDGFYSTAMAVTQLPSNFSMSYGSAPSIAYQGSDSVMRNVPALVYTDTKLRLYGRSFPSLGLSNLKLGSDTPIFFVTCGGVTNSNITVWYRVKLNPADGGTWRFAGTFEHGIPSGARAYESASSAFSAQISVPKNYMIEFGINALNGLGLPVNPANDSIYSGYINVKVFNW